MIWEKEIECCDHKKIEEIQLTRLRHMVEKAYCNVPFYQKKLDEAGVRPEDIKTLDDIKHIPFTTKTDMRDQYPFGLFAEPMKNISRIHASSGTTGKPVVAGYTKSDIENWANAIARIATAAGVTDEDIAQVAFGYGLFTGGFGLHYGLEKLGAALVPMSSGNTQKQIMLMQDFDVTTLIATPSYAMYISEVIAEMGIPRSNFKLKYGLFGAEGMSEEMRRTLEERYGVLVTTNYGLTEISGPGVSGECEYKCGQHINEDMFFVEIIDPNTGEVLPYGEKGEVVITTLTKEAMPVLRYRTRDISYLIPEPCQCGRTTWRLANIQGRTDDMLIIKGVNVFPSQIESVVLGFPQVSPNYQLIVRRKNMMDNLEVVVELIDGSLLEKFSEIEKLEKQIADKIHSVLGLRVKLRLAEPKSIERTTGKSKRVVDLRGQE
ncbi:phenylacetate--CoA ligase family protein [Ructibacterium gallinarum]|uniref:Phenylacetate-coenzyme A ligase n=1 Tax=Ructibacterium gallinarum TaxID=2779355 RepID=A0A9D5LXG7_9FIRM|nr:phenylacetate--CoA ligase [Ructibacterium gallinarum]MBE5039661.1 phenylacetate--CoA ligase [Ructibacterium gallinarum]